MHTENANGPYLFSKYEEIFLYYLGVFTIPIYCQLPAGFAIVKINKSIKDFKLDSINLSSPLNNYLSRTWIRINGKPKYWSAISTFQFNLSQNRPDEDISDQTKQYILNEQIKGIITYCDSAASVISYNESDNLFFINYCWIEDGKWVNGGQNLASTEDEVLDIVIKNLPIQYANIPRIALIKQKPSNVKPFYDFISTIRQSPEEFLLRQLESHKLVINGEYHRRKVSWDMLKRLIAMPDFAHKVGTVFLELPSWCQSKMDEFMASETLKQEIILEIFREEQPLGWWDKGEFEFICDLRRINMNLPATKKIKVILADYQLPYSKLTKSEEWKEQEDRNAHMAHIISKTILSSDDHRGNLFLVGCGHAYKSEQKGIGSSAHNKTAFESAGAQLAKILGDKNVFCVFQHVLSSDNNGNNKSLLRGGIFDKAFELNGNRPIGFELVNSPFGDEPFDGIHEIKYNIMTGSYADNFDGYLFLHPLDNEPQAAPLTEVFTDEFVNEIKRRAKLMGNENNRNFWFGRKATELTKQYIVEILLKDN